MAYNPNAPEDDQTLAAFPPEMREQLRAIINDQIVNALTVMGLSPGNASGNIAVSNGIRCVNLNADKLDDKEASAFAPAGWVPPVATGSINGSMSNADKAKLDGIEAGAQKNQNAFSKVLIGSTTIQSDSATDTLELFGGQNIEITPDATNDRATIGITGAISVANGGTGAATAVGALTNLGLTSTAAELNYCDGVTSNIQTQLNAKAPLASPAFTGTPTAPNASIDASSTQIATTAYVTAKVNAIQTVPVGTYIESACSTAPAGYLLCDGSTVSRITYAALFVAIGTTYGAGDGSTTFNLPDRRDRFALAKGSTYTPLGVTGGEINHTLAANEMPSHGHDASAQTDSQGNHVHSLSVWIGSDDGPNVSGFDASGRSFGTVTTSNAGAHSHNVGISISNTGGGAAHNNMPPYVVVNYFIKY